MRCVLGIRDAAERGIHCFTIGLSQHENGPVIMMTALALRNAGYVVDVRTEEEDGHKVRIIDIDWLREPS